MIDFTEQDFKRLVTDKNFAIEVLCSRSYEMLRAAFYLYAEKQEKKGEIIDLITYAVDVHLDSVMKFIVIHDLSLAMGNLTVIGLKNLYILGAPKVMEFFDPLQKALSYIEIKEIGKQQGKEEIFAEILSKKDDGIQFNRFRGFHTTFTDEQLSIHYNGLKGKYINKNTTLNNYIAVFRESNLPANFKPVMWMLLNDKRQPNKTALREFLTLALGKSPYQNTISICFTDQKGEKILLAKPKNGEFSNHYSFFEKLFKD